MHLMTNSKKDLTKTTTPDGFTMVEILVVLVIIAVLSALGFAGIKRAQQSALMTANIANLRNLGSVMLTLQDDNGGLPAGYNSSTGESWATLVVAQVTGGSAKQDKILLAPTVTKSIPPQFNSEAISNYAVNPMIFPDFAGQGADAAIKYRVTPIKLSRPSQQILLGDALPRSATAPYGHSMIIWWGLRGDPTGNTWDNPPMANPAASGRPITLPRRIAEFKTDSGAGLPAFRNRGKGHFLFADGHVESLAPSDLKQKHFAISY